MNSVSKLQAVLLIIAPMTANGQVASEYRLSAGDVLQISVAGAPDLARRISISLDGSASFPLIGEIQVAGLSLSEIRTRIRDLIPARGYKNRKFSGSDALDVIDRDEISLDVAEYRPLYILGDIVKAGEVAYRPGMTVMQAIAVAGGYRSPSELENSTIRRTYETALIAFATEKVRIWRLRAMLGRANDAFDDKEIAGLGRETIQRMINLQTEHMKALQDDHKQQKEELQIAITLANQRVKALAAQLDNEKTSARLDSDELERAQELSKKGIVAANRLTEVHRTALLSATRTLQTDVATEGAKRERQEVEAKLERLDGSLRIELLRDLDVATAKADTLELQVRAAREQLLSSFRTGAEKPIIKVQRDGTALTEMTEGTPLAPGDVIEVHRPPSTCSAIATATC